MKDWSTVVCQLNKAVGDVVDRIHLRRSDQIGVGTHAHVEMVRWDNPADLLKILDSVQHGDHPVFEPGPDGRLIGFATGAPAGAAPRAATPIGTPTNPELVEGVSRLARAIDEARVADFALRLKVSAAKAAQVLGAKPKSPTAGNAQTPQEDHSVSLGARLQEFKQALLATLQRAMDVNGVASRAGDHLISALAELQPRKEKVQNDYSRAHVPDAFMDELAVAIEVGAQDFVTVLLDHIEVFWRTEIVRALTEEETLLVSKAGLTPEAARASFSGDLRRLRKAIHKAGDDFALRMRSGGVSAPVLAIPKPFGALSVLGSAVRYPMQFAALATFILIPAALVMGISLEATSGPALLRGLVIFVLPVLLVLAFYQARRTRILAIDAALENARRQIHAEKAKTAREISEAVGSAVSTFIDSLDARLEHDVIAAAEAIRRHARKREDSGRELTRTATSSRVKALEQLQDDLASAIGAAQSQIGKLLEAELAVKARVEARAKGEIDRAAALASRQETRRRKLEEAKKKRAESRAGKSTELEGAR
ncbi:hypothetical protein [Mesorhizobium sp. KR1-2]|uniref:hypothetical protein n=1 Tax=Mesorhizobium sp. KR1-2 TaxID=3156609 RepID=UPI0032B35A79